MRTNKRVCAIIIRENKILMIHRKKRGFEFWIVIGGGVEDTETLEEALIREVKEETSCEVIQYEKRYSFKEAKKQHYFYTCTLKQTDVTLAGPEFESNSAQNSFKLEWVDLEKLPTLNMYPHSILEALKKMPI